MLLAWVIKIKTALLSSLALTALTLGGCAYCISNLIVKPIERVRWGLKAPYSIEQKLERWLIERRIVIKGIDSYIVHRYDTNFDRAVDVEAYYRMRGGGYESGKPYRYLIDSNYDGQFDHELLDLDGDGKPDKVIDLAPAQTQAQATPP